MSEERKIRHIYLYKNYFSNFFEKQKNKVKDRIIWTFRVIETLPVIPTNYFKHVERTNGLYEIRVQSGNDIYRIFCFFDKSNIIVVEHSFQKKTQKTPQKEIDIALRIKQEYEFEKKGGKNE